MQLEGKKVLVVVTGISGISATELLIKKEIDNEVDFINSSGDIIRSIEEATSITTESQGEQLAAIMNNIIETAKHDNKSSRKLWLPNIPEIITFNYLLKKYNFQRTKYNLSIPIGEYDAPELQELRFQQEM